MSFQSPGMMCSWEKGRSELEEFKGEQVQYFELFPLNRYVRNVWIINDINLRRWQEVGSLISIKAEQSTWKSVASPRCLKKCLTWEGNGVY